MSAACVNGRHTPFLGAVPVPKVGLNNLCINFPCPLTRIWKFNYAHFVYIFTAASQVKWTMDSCHLPLLFPRALSQLGPKRVSCTHQHHQAHRRHIDPSPLQSRHGTFCVFMKRQRVRHEDHAKNTKCNQMLPWLTVGIKIKHNSRLMLILLHVLYTLTHICVLSA